MFFSSVSLFAALFQLHNKILIVIVICLPILKLDIFNCSINDCIRGDPKPNTSHQWIVFQCDSQFCGLNSNIKLIRIYRNLLMNRDSVWFYNTKSQEMANINSIHNDYNKNTMALCHCYRKTWPFKCLGLWMRLSYMYTVRTYNTHTSWMRRKRRMSHWFSCEFWKHVCICISLIIQSRFGKSI